MDHARINIRAGIEQLLVLSILVRQSENVDLHESMLTNCVNWLEDWHAGDAAAMSAFPSLADEPLRTAITSAWSRLVEILDQQPPITARDVVAHAKWPDVERSLVAAYERLALDS